MWSRLCSPAPWLLGIALAVALPMMAGCGGQAEKSAEQHVEQTMVAKSQIKICKSQTYALCAAARCNVYDGVAYCQCQVKSGNSISLTFNMGKRDVCSVNAAGANNRYMVSTYSLPPEVVAPHGNRAVYSCSGGPSQGAYAQCDGGLCFTSTENTTFPGFDKPVPKGQIICSCPVTTPTGSARVVGHGILGPYPCQQSFFKYCHSDTANTNTGSTVYVGAPPGMVQNLAVSLNGHVPTLNQCHESGGP